MPSMRLWRGGGDGEELVVGWAEAHETDQKSLKAHRNAQEYSI